MRPTITCKYCNRPLSRYGTHWFLLVERCRIWRANRNLGGTVSPLLSAMSADRDDVLCRSCLQSGIDRQPAPLACDYVVPVPNVSLEKVVHGHRTARLSAPGFRVIRKIQSLVAKPGAITGDFHFADMRVHA